MNGTVSKVKVIKKKCFRYCLGVKGHTEFKCLSLSAVFNQQKCQPASLINANLDLIHYLVPHLINVDHK